MKPPEPEWTFGLQCTGYGSLGNLRRMNLVSPEPEKNKVVYNDDFLFQCYENTEKGLEHSFTINSPGKGDIFEMQMMLTGNLRAFLKDKKTVELLTHGGVKVLEYGNLIAEDSEGNPVDCSFQITENTLSVKGKWGNAVYPVVISMGLSTSENWAGESNQADAEFGNSVSTAGDVNGDGYSDVIVGSIGYDNGETDEGRAYVFYGSSVGLSSSADWTAESNQTGARFGHSVSTAGDVNGDGYSDVIVGSIGYDNGETDEGRAYVFYGSSTGLSSSADWTAESNQAGALFGISVSSAGDVNGDGYSDVIIGANQYNNGELDEGRSFVYIGSFSGLSTTTDWTDESNQSSARFGHSVSTAGDVNGDGYSDVIVGAPFFDNGETDEGAAFVYYGNRSNGITMTPGQFKSDETTPVQIYGYSDSPGGIAIKLRAYTPFGRMKVKLQWEAAILKIPFGWDFTLPGGVLNSGESDWIDTENGVTQITEKITGLEASNPCHWRARLLYHPASGSGHAASRWFSIQGNGWNESDFRTESTDYIISGRVTDGVTPIQGVTISFSHDSGTAVTDSSGNYSYTVPYKTTTIISPSHGGYSNWSPGFIVLNNIDSDTPNQNFTGTANSYIVSGIVTDGTNPISGVVMAFSHDSSVVYSDVNGYYSLAVPFGTTTTITPSKAGYSSWSPPSRTLNTISSNQPDQDFSATLNGVMISGTITDGANPIQGSTISFSHDFGTAVTDASGNYSYGVPYGTTTTLTPSHSGYSNWNPTVITLNNITTDTAGQNFSGSANGYIVSGTVTDGTNPISGVAITLISDSATGFTGEVVYTDVNGNYSTSLPYGTSTMLTPSKAGYSAWSPPSRTINGIASNQAGQDFTAILNSVAVSGNVTDRAGYPLQGVRISFSHDGGSVDTDSSGNYMYYTAYGTTTNIVPSLSNHSFEPVQISLNNITSDTPGQNFSATTTSFVIMATSGPGGTITPYGSVNVIYGENQTFTFEADTGYHLNYVMVDGDIISPPHSYSFKNVTENHTIHSDFAINQPPVIDSFTSDRLSGNLPLDVTFTCEARDPDGGSIVRYQWTIDGEEPEVSESPFSTLAFHRAGEYHVFVTVTDDEGETTDSEDIVIVVTDASPIMLPVSFGSFLDSELNTTGSRSLFRVINPFNEEMAIIIECVDDTGNVNYPAEITIPANGKTTINPSDFARENTQALKLASDHYYLLTAEVNGDVFRSSNYLPLKLSHAVTIPHVAEEVQSWQSLCYSSNQKNMPTDLLIHGQPVVMERHPALQINLTQALPDAPVIAESWVTLSIQGSGPFGSTGELTGFELFVRHQSDGGMVELSSDPLNTLYIPHIPLESHLFWTGFAFVNPSEMPISAVATLHSDNGDTSGTYTFEVPAFSKVKYLLEDIFPGSAGNATWGVIEADGDGLIGMELYGTEAGGICGFSLNDNIFTRGILPLIEHSAETWTSMAFTNPGMEDAEITVTLMSDSGKAVASTTGFIHAGERITGTAARVFFTGEDIHSGQYIKFTSTVPILALEVMGHNDWYWMTAIGGK